MDGASKDKMKTERKEGGKRMYLARVITHKWPLQLFKCSLSHIIINYQAIEPRPQKLNFPTLAAWIKREERILGPELSNHDIQDRPNNLVKMPGHLSKGLGMILDATRKGILKRCHTSTMV